MKLDITRRSGKHDVDPAPAWLQTPGDNIDEIRERKIQERDVSFLGLYSVFPLVVAVAFFGSIPHDRPQVADDVKGGSISLAVAMAFIIPAVVNLVLPPRTRVVWRSSVPATSPPEPLRAAAPSGDALLAKVRRFARELAPTPLTAEQLNIVLERASTPEAVAFLAKHRLSRLTLTERVSDDASHPIWGWFMGNEIQLATSRPRQEGGYGWSFNPDARGEARIFSTGNAGMNLEDGIAMTMTHEIGHDLLWVATEGANAIESRDAARWDEDHPQVQLTGPRLIDRRPEAWKLKRDLWEAHANRGDAPEHVHPLTAYGDTNPEEYFAETFALYEHFGRKVLLLHDPVGLSFVERALDLVGVPHQKESDGSE